jgi:deoxycytidine triphosphate deaminase
MDLENLKIEQIKSGRLPGYFFPKLIELGHLKIIPFNKNSLGNISYYLHFNNKFREPITGNEPIDLLDKKSIDSAFYQYKEMENYVLHPGKSVIAQTYEKVGCSEWLLCKLENTSALGRVLLNHASPGFLHPGHGIENPFNMMIELTNLGERPVIIESAKLKDGKIIGPDSFRFYVEKLAYPTIDYKSISNVSKLKMDNFDKS